MFILFTFFYISVTTPTVKVKFFLHNLHTFTLFRSINIQSETNKRKKLSVVIIISEYLKTLIIQNNPTTSYTIKNDCIPFRNGKHSPFLI